MKTHWNVSIVGACYDGVHVSIGKIDRNHLIMQTEQRLNIDVCDSDLLLTVCLSWVFVTLKRTKCCLLKITERNMVWPKCLSYCNVKYRNVCECLSASYFYQRANDSDIGICLELVWIRAHLKRTFSYMGRQKDSIFKDVNMFGTRLLFK